ncbi:MAG: hypothetical protein ACRDFS_11905 [Chloroflexota bacterium]
MAGLSKEEFDTASKEIITAWQKAASRDAGFNVIVEYGRKHGYKNVIAAIQGRTPKRFSNGQPVSEWLDERHQEEESA